MLMSERGISIMDEKTKDLTVVKLAEIERLIREFREKFDAGVSDADNFITISEIEQLWGELRYNTNNVYSDMICELMSSVDESDLIRKKKRIPTRRGNTAHPQKERALHNHYAWQVVISPIHTNTTKPRQQRKTFRALRFKNDSAA